MPLQILVEDTNIDANFGDNLGEPNFIKEQPQQDLYEILLPEISDNEFFNVDDNFPTEITMISQALFLPTLPVSRVSARGSGTMIISTDIYMEHVLEGSRK